MSLHGHTSEADSECKPYFSSPPYYPKRASCSPGVRRWRSTEHTRINITAWLATTVCGGRKERKRRPRFFPSTMRAEYIIEHMEEDEPEAPAHFPPWALLEYRHMLYHVGEGTTVHFTALSRASLDALHEAFRQPLPPLTQKPARFELHAESVTTLAQQRGWDTQRICLLDPKAPLPLLSATLGYMDRPRRRSRTFCSGVFSAMIRHAIVRPRCASLDFQAATSAACKCRQTRRWA